MSFTVIYDACVLYPAPLRDLLIRLGMSGIVRARWTDAILDEVFHNILADRPDLDQTRLARSRSLMNAAIRDVLVEGYEPLIPALELPDPEDRHVLAAAIRCGAQAIVTRNLRDFPAPMLEPWGLEALHPDEFVVAQVHLAPGVVLQKLNEQASCLKNPPMSLGDLLTVLENNGLVRSMAELRRLLNAY